MFDLLAGDVVELYGAHQLVQRLAQFGEPRGLPDGYGAGALPALVEFAQSVTDLGDQTREPLQLPRTQFVLIRERREHASLQPRTRLQDALPAHFMFSESGCTSSARLPKSAPDAPSRAVSIRVRVQIVRKIDTIWRMPENAARICAACDA